MPDQAAGGANLTLIINPNSAPDYTGQDATVYCLPHLKAKGATLIGCEALCRALRALLQRPPAQ